MSVSEVKLTFGRNSVSDRDEFARCFFNPAERVYARVDNPGSSRYGTIAVMSPSGYDPKDRSSWPILDFLTTSSYRNTYYCDLMHDDGRITKAVSVNNLNLVWLKGYVGPTVWKFTRGPSKPKVPKPPAMDRLGHEVSIGDLVVFAANSYRYSTGSLFFGTVRKISDKGIPTVEAFKTRDNDSTNTYRITRSDRITKLTADILDDLMIRRLMY